MFQAQNRETKLVLEKLLCPPRSLCRRAWQDCISHHNTKPARPRLRPIFWSQTVLVLRQDHIRPHHHISDHITGLGNAVSSPVGFGSEPWPPKDFFTIFSTRDGLSWHYNIALLWITKQWKILNPFNLDSITVHLVMLFDVFSIRNYSQSESGKWWSSLQGRGEVDGGGEFDTWGNPPKQCRIKTTWALAHRRN